MAFNYQEIELKLPLTKLQFQSILKRLNKDAKPLGGSNHKDHYFTPKRESFLKAKYPYEWLTVRERDGKILLNYKHWYPVNTKYTTHCDEYETIVANAEQAIKILEALNFEQFIVVEKVRNTFNFQAKFEIAMDRVKGLGYFIEVETIKDFGSVEKARDEILQFTKSLGLSRTKTVPGGYAAALMRKKGISR